MIVREFYATREDGVNLYRTYSDMNLYIKQLETGNIYSDAVDIESANYTYEETDILIEDDTQRHLAAVNGLESKDAIESYDYREGYPTKLEF